MRNVTVVVGALVSVVVLFSPVVDAWAVPPDVSYQGQLLDASGAPLNGTVNIQARVYPNEDLTGGETPLFVEDHADVPVTNGVFQVLLGRGTASLGEMNAELFANDERYLEVHVNGERIEPRQAMSSVPYSFQAENVSGFTAAQLSGLHVFDVHENDLGLFVKGGVEHYAFLGEVTDYTRLRLYNTSLGFMYEIVVQDCTETPAPSPPELRYIFNAAARDFSWPLIATRFYTEPDCEGQAYVSADPLYDLSYDEYFLKSFAGTLPAATILDAGRIPNPNTNTSHVCVGHSVILMQLNMDQIKLCPEFEVLSSESAPDNNCTPVTSPQPGECTATTPRLVAPITPFDPADLGFPYPIEGPLRIGLTP